MKIAILSMVMLLIAGTALALDIAKDPDLVNEGVFRASHDIRHAEQAQVAVVSLYQGLFEDLSGYYLAGLASAGLMVDFYSEPKGAVDYSGYDLVLVTTADNHYGNSFRFEIPVLSAYMDGGGKVIVIGQDWLWGSEDYGFAVSYLGVAGATEDANSGDPGTLDWAGTEGGPLAGLSGSMTPCFQSAPNDFYTDTIEPAEQGLIRWNSPLSPEPREGGAVGTNGMLCTVELACGSVDAVGSLVTWWLASAQLESSVSNLKSRY